MKEIEIYEAQADSEVLLQYADGGIHAGFPSPAQDYIESGIDLNKILVRHRESTFYGRVVGNSMIDAGIDEGDILVIDKSLQPQDGDMVVCYINGEFALKFMHKGADHITLKPANTEYPDIVVRAGEDFRVWGVVTYTIKKRNRRV